MFQFRRFPTYTYLIQCTLHGYCPCGLPHSEISGSMDICSSPKLIAACHVLRRLLMPRHSPCALYNLTNQKQIFTCSRCELCRLHRFEIVIVTLHPFGCCSTIKILLPCLFRHRTSLLPYLSLSSTLFSFQGASPASFEARFEDPTFRLGLQIQQQITVWWARVGSNHRPYDYQSYALAS